MRPRATIFRFLLFSCLFCCVGGIAGATELASVSYVDNSIQRNNSTGDIVIKNTTANSSVTLSQNPQTSNIQTSTNKEVATIGWTDTNRTSKVRNGQNGTTLVDMWIE